MKTVITCLFIVCLSAVSQQTSKLRSIRNSPESSTESILRNEIRTNWALNLYFSDNGFGLGGSLHQPLSKNVSLFESISFSTAKDDREFESVDFFGNTFTPYKKNRLFITPVSVGFQFRLFRNSVSNDLRPLFQLGTAVTPVIYTPYDQPFFSSFKFAKVKFAYGGFAGIGVDYLSNKTSSLSLNVRYYYSHIFGQGVESLNGFEKNFFGGLTLVFSYNFMK